MGRWAAGSEGADARGSNAELDLQRVALVLEERFTPRPWVYVLARVSPGWLHGTASLTDTSVPAPLETTFSTFSLDASLGAALRLTPRGLRAALWLVADGGYGWAPSQRLALAPALPGANAENAGTTTLADLAPRGAFYRLVESAGLRRITFYHARHSALSYLLNSGQVPIAVVAAWAGHADGGATALKHYIRVRPGDLEAARDAIAALLGA